jgi:hypothetical protein
MEQFSVAAQHSGAINHVHTFLFPPSTVQALREVRLAVTVIAVAFVTVKALQHFGTETRRRN